MYKSGFAKVNGTSLNYEMAGEGEAIVLIHSGFTDLRLWDKQFDFFSKSYKVIRYDVRGFGKSETPSKSFSHIEDLKGLLNFLEVQRVNLIGVSMGGSIAIDFTLEYPELVKSLILSGPSLNGYQKLAGEVSTEVSLATVSIASRDENFEKSVEFMINTPIWRQNDAESQARLKNMFLDTSLEWALKDIEVVANPPAAERLHEIDKKTLLIIGSEDSEPIMKIAKFLEDGIVDLQRVDIKGTGHVPNLDKHEVFNQIVMEFLDNN
ncbi:alpha/beta fold hydrolase [Inconstantimicrobium mannanitabidum]|uniref:Hydrolase n=1 Tax=Inconstantimicrobium mannanitabidum TaxID=1604901 RepID=A0ACB5RFT6_9CLOT|nr:alpha/beta hydrolase [Clostridium sp. TW13]GKX67940.1 hydrolase [Clostridium sp. TW13]